MNFEMIQNEYSDALTVMFNAVQGSVHEFKEFEPWRADTHSLALKMYRHLTAIKALCEIGSDEQAGYSSSYYIDFSSAQIVTRAAIETFLTFAYVFGQEDLTLSKFRSEIWQLSGLADRQKLQPSTLDSEQKLATEKLDMEKLRTSIASSPHLSSIYTEKQATRILAGGWSQLRDWGELAEAAGIDSRYFENTYKHLCGFSHSSYISTLQISQARDMQTQLEMARACLCMCLFYTAHFVVTFSKISSSAALYLSKDETAIKLIEKWHITVESWQEVYAAQDAEMTKKK
jgi:regulator of RNase E activity RraB